MIIESTTSISPGQPAYQFLQELSTSYEALQPATREHLEAAWEPFMQLITDLHRAQQAVPQIRDGTYYMRHTLQAAHQDVSACASEALECISDIKNRGVIEAITDPTFNDLMSVAISFLKSICENPQLLSIKVPQPLPAVRSASLPER